MPTDPAHTKDELLPDPPLVCIDSKDASSANTIRKFLESHGCVVAESGNVSQELTYHIVIGDSPYVVSILARPALPSQQLFLIVHNATRKDIETWITTPHTKVWVTPTLPLENAMVNVLFAFFFAGAGQIGGSVAYASTLPEVSEQKGSLSRETASEKNPTREAVAPGAADVLSSSQSKDKTGVEEEWEKRQATIGVLLKNEIPTGKKTEISHERAGMLSRFKNGLTKSGEPFTDKGDTHKQRRGLFYKLLHVGVTFGFLFLLWYGVSFGIAGEFILLSGRSLLRGDVTWANDYARLSQLFIHQDQSIVGAASYVLGFIGKEHILRSHERLLSFMEAAAQSEEHSAALIDNGREVAAILFAKDGTNKTPALAMERMKVRMKQVDQWMGIADAELRILMTEKSFPFSIPQVFDSVRKKEIQLDKGRRLLGSVDKLLELYPAISGFKEKKTYLLLLQNSAELRPTGGFIGSIALISFEEGKMQDLTVQDVYAVDGQLKGHIDPPMPLREQMNQEHWYLRDSNWDPDFSVSGPRAGWFYQKETGITVDGVFAINSPFIVDLLSATGPIKLVDYNDTITADNFYAKSLFYTHSNFFPGSTQKKDFLGSLLTALLGSLSSENTSLSTTKLLSSVSEALDKGDVLFSFTDPQAQNLVRYSGWGGVLPENFQCSGQISTCLGDGVMQIDANLGVNKVNYFITKKQSQAVVIGEDGSILGEAGSTYHNSSTSDDPAIGGGVYKNYARWYVPKDATVSAIAIGGVSVPVRDPKNPKVPPLPYAEIDQSTPGWVVVGVAFTVAPSEDRQVTISYKRTATLSVDSDVAHYQFTNIVQPGLRNNQFDLTLSYPMQWNALVSDGSGVASLVAKEGRLQYNTPIAKTQTITIGFSR